VKNCFIYVSQVPREGTEGQNQFEKGFINALLKKANADPKLEIKVFSPSIGEEKSKDARLTLIPLTNKKYSGYLLYQFRLCYQLGSFLWNRRKENLGMFIRYHPAMFAPLVCLYLFDIPFSMRSGPVLKGLFYYNKNPGTVVFHCIKWLLGQFYLKASVIVTVAEKVKQVILETYELEPSKIQVIPNVADTSLFFFEPPNRKKWQLPENEFVFGFTGTTDDSQGLDTIIQALGLLKKKQKKVPFLFLVGDGHYRTKLQSMSEELGITESIIWTGYIPHEDVRSAINACDVMLAPVAKKHLEFKGSGPLKIWEYLACDKPILVSEHRDHQFLQDSNLGKMVEPDNIELWAEALAIEAEKRDFLLQGRGRKFVVEGHSYEILVKRFISISFWKNSTHTGTKKPY
jgi:glycosyltransferase involved in cell wall biosynthesis